MKTALYVNRIIIRFCGVLKLQSIEVVNENFGLHRIIWNKHVKEISELKAKEALEPRKMF